MNTNKHKSIFGFRHSTFLVALCATLVGCGQQEPTVRRYTEVSVPPPMAHHGAGVSGQVSAPFANQQPSSSIQDPASSTASLTWSAPSGWSETPGAGMRLATFNVAEAECTIISLPGNVGGLEANLQRWAGQIGAPTSHEALHPFMDGAESFETVAGNAGQFFDFQKLSAATQQSMLAGIIKMGEATVFVKMTGTPATLNAERDKFLTLCKSIQTR